MSGGMNSMEFFTNLMGQPNSINQSADGNAINMSNQIADGINMNMTIRPSSSTGIGIDANIDGNVVRHIENIPKF